MRPPALLRLARRNSHEFACSRSPGRAWAALARIAPRTARGSVTRVPDWCIRAAFGDEVLRRYDFLGQLLFLEAWPRWASPPCLRSPCVVLELGRDVLADVRAWIATAGKGVAQPARDPETVADSGGSRARRSRTNFLYTLRRISRPFLGVRGRGSLAVGRWGARRLQVAAQRAWSASRDFRQV